MCLPGPALSVNIYGSGGPFLERINLEYTCTVVGGYPEPTIQWFRNGAPYSTSRTVFFGAFLNRDGDVMTCQATNDFGVVDSNAITLEILGEACPLSV